MSEHGAAPPAGTAAQEGGWLLVNGERRPLPPQGVLIQLLEASGITPETKGVAVAVNDEVVRRADWAHRRLQPGDRVEIVRAVQGG